MTILIIIIIVTVLYFIITAVKEKETRDAIQIERNENNKNIADIHFQNLLQNELFKQKKLLEIHNNFISELENEDYINHAFIDGKVLNIELTNHTDSEDASEFANNLVNSLNPTTQIDVVKIYDNHNFHLATSRRISN